MSTMEPSSEGGNQPEPVKESQQGSPSSVNKLEAMEVVEEEFEISDDEDTMEGDEEEGLEAMEDEEENEISDDEDAMEGDEEEIEISDDEDGDGIVGSKRRLNYMFDQEVATKKLAAMMVVHEYPLCMVNHVGFRRFVSTLQPSFKMVTRNTIRNDIIKLYEDEKKRVISYIGGNKSNVAISTEMWTSHEQQKFYMAIRTHFIDHSWKPRSIVLRFINVPNPYTAGDIVEDTAEDIVEETAQELNDSLVAWNLDKKVSTLIVDSCPTNDKLIDLLVRKIGKSKLMVKGSMLHMRCGGNILNLIVKDGLDIIQNAIVRIRDSVAFWTATPKRMQKFEEIAKSIKVTITQRLCLDFEHRWDSTFTMLDVAIPYKAVFTCACAMHVDKLYNSCPSDEDWLFAADVVEMLRMFYEVTVIFSRTQRVTANLYFPKICEIKMNMRQWSTCGNKTIEAMTVGMNEKFDKYLSDIQGLMGIAVLLDPRFKTEMVLVCFEMLMGITGDECEDRVREVTKTLCDLMNEYQVENDEDNIESSVPLPSIEAATVMSIFNARIVKRRPASSLLKSELDRYLEDDYVPVTKDFDVLDWWKVAGIQYPTLRMIARDIYAIPVSIVASESAFNTSGSVVSEHRSRLTPKMLEALTCLQDWLRNQYRGDEKGLPMSLWTVRQDICEETQDWENN